MSNPCAANGPAVCFPIWRFARYVDPYAAAQRYIERHYTGDPLQGALLESVCAALRAIRCAGTMHLDGL